MKGADPVTKIRSIVTARAPNGTMMNREDYGVALARAEHLDAGLATRLLLHEDEFPSLEVPPLLA